ncbi:MAG: class I SAM-dependent methyltransferase [Deltaproteobacteria bacterium]
MAARASGTRLVDVGCGHGVLTALLAVGFPDRTVTGIDPDARKIDWARRSIGKTPMWPQISMLVISTDEIERAQRPTPSAAISSSKSPTYSWSERTGISSPSATAALTFKRPASGASALRRVWMWKSPHWTFVVSTTRVSTASSSRVSASVTSISVSKISYSKPRETRMR